MRIAGAVIASTLLGSACGRANFDLRGADGTDAANDGSLDASAKCLGTTHLVTDNFDLATTNTALWSTYADPGTSHVQSGGALQLNLANNSASKYTGYTSLADYDLRGDRLFIEIVEVPASTGNLLLGVSSSPNDYLSIEYSSGQIRAARTIAGVFEQRASTIYDASRQRFLQLRDLGGSVVWETSPDGVAWKTLLVEAAPFQIAAVKLLISAGTYVADPSPGRARFDNFNGGAAPIDCP